MKNRGAVAYFVTVLSPISPAGSRGKKGIFLGYLLYESG